MSIPERSFSELYPEFQIEFRNDSKIGQHAIVWFRYKKLEHLFIPNMSGTLFVAQQEALRITPATLLHERPDVLDEVGNDMLDYGNRPDLSYDQLMLISKAVFGIDRLIKENRRTLYSNR